jgi:hypothetical protein
MPVDSDPPPLPTFDARLYEPPAWATDPLHAKGTPKAAAAVDGVDSSDGEYSDDDATPEPSAEDLGVEETDSTIRFTIDELKVSFSVLFCRSSSS